MKGDSQLYIDNILVDIDEDTDITLSMKSNLLNGFAMEVNRTYSIKLPKTVRNRRVLGFSDMVQRGVTAPYHFHDARYLRNGVEIISNGKAAVMEANDEGFVLAIIWGLFPAFADLMSNGMVLRDLVSSDKIRFQEVNEVAQYVDAVAADYFYADMDTLRVDDEEKVKDFGEVATGRRSNLGGRRGEVTTPPIHPCVKVSWILRMIREQMGVDFVWSGDEKSYIDTLILPMVSKKATEDSYEGGFKGTIPSVTSVGYVPVDVEESTSVIKETSGRNTSLTLEADADMFVSLSVQWTYDFNGLSPTGKRTTGMRRGSESSRKVTYYYSLRRTPYLKVKVTRGYEDAVYQVGSGSGGVVDEDMLVNGIFTSTLGDEGMMSLKAGDKMTIELVMEGVDGSFSTSRVKFLGGTLSMSAADSDEVPIGGFYPLAANLPEIKVVDFVKFLCIITGTFPVQKMSGNKCMFVRISDLWDNIGSAVDWTRRVIAPSGENSPMGMSFKGDFCQHNLYRWKEDETVTGSYDGDLEVVNETLDNEKVMADFPFAASDGSSVPLYKKNTSTTSSSSSGSFGGQRSGDDDTATSTDDLEDEEKWKFSECKPRIMRLMENNGKASAEFDIDMKIILRDKYEDLSRTLQTMKVVKESIRIREMELRDFDETVPVYLAQYGCYFAVLEMKAQDNGLAEVTMLQLIFG